MSTAKLALLSSALFTLLLSFLSDSAHIFLQASHFSNYETDGSALSCIKTPCRGRPRDYAQRAGRGRDRGAQRDAASQFQAVDPPKRTQTMKEDPSETHKVRLNSSNETKTKCIHSALVNCCSKFITKRFPSNYSYKDKLAGLICPESS